MTTMKVTLVVGAATPPGRLANAVEIMAKLIREVSDEDQVVTDIINLAVVKLDICDGRPSEACSHETRRAIQIITAASAVLLASPVYRASFPGVLKNLLDLLPIDALRGKPVGIVAMGSSTNHYLAVDSHLRQVLAWFGALVLPTSVYLTSNDFSAGQLVAQSGLSDMKGLATSLLLLARSVDRHTLGPPPLAAKFT